MQKTYNNLTNKLHNYLCKEDEKNKLQIHQSYVDNNKLLNSRLISFTYISIIYLWVLWDMPSITTNFIYLTLHGYLITWLFFAAVLQDYFIIKIFGKQIPVCAKLKYYVEIIYETAFCFQIPITLVFWTFLFPILLRNNATFSQILINANLHAGPLVCLSVDLYYNSFSFPKRHLWVLTIYGTFYLLINLVYSLTVKVIYDPIDWKSVLSYLITLSSYIFVYGTFYFGGFVYRKYKQPKISGRITQGLIKQNQIKSRAGGQNSTAGEES